MKSRLGNKLSQCSGYFVWSFSSVHNTCIVHEDNSSGTDSKSELQMIKIVNDLNLKRPLVRGA